jgi:hemoglobin-like flavoprotein
MTPEQVQLVRLSFVKVMDIKMTAGKLFYGRLFTIAPEVRSMFKDDIDAQAEKLMNTLALAIGALKNPVTLGGMLENLGRRHRGYGVQDHHYDKVAEALLWTLEQGLGDDFTPDVRTAWIALYGAVATAMKQAGQQQAIGA